MIRAFGLTMLMAFAARVGAQAPCTRAMPAGPAHFYVEAGSPAPRDSIIVVRLCLSSPSAIGSYMAVIRYDSSAARLTRAQTVGGMGAANPRVPGVVRLAAAAPSGLADGTIATLSFRQSPGKSLDQITLAVPEATTIGGASLTTRAMGWQANPDAPTRRPVIDSIRPTSGVIEHERVTDVVLYGRGFAAEGNVVDFGGAEVLGLASEGNGTLIRFSAPSRLPTRGARPARRIGPGRLQVRVKHAGGTSNAVLFTARGDA